MKDRILIICPEGSSSFVQQDAAILMSRYDVETLSINGLRKPKIFWTFLTVFLKLSRRKVCAVVMWFSIPHLAPIIVALARIFGTKILAITGGFDIAFVPRIAWGEMGSPWKRALQRFSLHRVDHILPFSDFSRTDTLRYAPSDNVSTLYMGIDCNHFTPSGDKVDLVITTCNVVNGFTILQKGLSTFAHCAELLPEYRFLIIGKVQTNDERARHFQDHAPANLEFTGEYVSDTELLSLYRKARAYVQISVHEGFGIACAEAMACECVPVGTTNTSLPEVIGETGYLVGFDDVPATVKAIKSAMTNHEKGAAARKRVVQLFPVEKRSTGILAIMKQVLEN